MVADGTGGRGIVGANNGRHDWHGEIEGAPDDAVVHTDDVE